MIEFDLFALKRELRETGSINGVEEFKGITLERELAEVRGVCSDLETNELEELIESNPHGNITPYMLNRVFVNNIRVIPSDLPDIRQGFVDFACSQIKAYDIKGKVEDNLTLNIIASFTDICNSFFTPGMLRSNLGESEVYEQTAEDILKYYHTNKRDIKQLKRVGEALDQNYLALFRFLDHGEDYKKNEPGFKILSEISKEKGEEYLRNPLVVKEIWERTKEKYEVKEK